MPGVLRGGPAWMAGGSCLSLGGPPGAPLASEGLGAPLREGFLCSELSRGPPRLVVGAPSNDERGLNGDRGSTGERHQQQGAPTGATGAPLKASEAEDFLAGVFVPSSLRSWVAKVTLNPKP